MQIVLQRTNKTGEAIDGSLVIDGVWFCDTAEHPATALPAGVYTIHRTHCKQYGRFMPVLVSGRCDKCTRLGFVCNNTSMPCICNMLKPGNGVHKRADGSIILGKRIVSGCLSHPREGFEILSERLRKLSSRASILTLKIEEHYEE